MWLRSCVKASGLPRIENLFFTSNFRAKLLFEEGEIERPMQFSIDLVKTLTRSIEHIPKVYFEIEMSENATEVWKCFITISALFWLRIEKKVSQSFNHFWQKWTIQCLLGSQMRLFCR